MSLEGWGTETLEILPTVPPPIRLDFEFRFFGQGFLCRRKTPTQKDRPLLNSEFTANHFSPHALQQRRAGGHGTSLNLREDPGSLPSALILVAAVAGKDSSKCGRGTTLGIIIFSPFH